MIADPRDASSRDDANPDWGGQLYRLDRDGLLALLQNDAALPNGLGIALDRDSLYFAEGAPGSWEVEGDGAGALFGVDLDVRGLPESRSQVGL